MDNNRYIFYGDYLGTRERYSTKPELVVRARELLEQALNHTIVSYLEDNNMYLYVFSDTFIITCPELSLLLKPVSVLFDHFLIYLNDGRKSNIWLRGAISYGTILESSLLKDTNHKRLEVISLLDTSLPRAYKYESIRAGSRIFIDPNINGDSFGSSQEYFLKWKKITGHGEEVKNIGEFLWPAIIYNKSQLSSTTMKLYKRWKTLLKSKDWNDYDYQKSIMRQLDETVKLLIRASSKFCSEIQKRTLLFSLLPKSRTNFINVRYEWGFWFQIVKGVIEDCEMTDSLKQDVKCTFKIVKSILDENDFWLHFLGELKHPDYQSFKKKFNKMGLHK